MYEVIEGRYKVKKPSQKRPIDEYLRLQGRFRHLNEEQVKRIQADIDTFWKKLLKKEEISGV